mgnify:CR=1 FL=1
MYNSLQRESRSAAAPPRSPRSSLLSQRLNYLYKTSDKDSFSPQEAQNEPQNCSRASSGPTTGPHLRGDFARPLLLSLLPSPIAPPTPNYTKWLLLLAASSSEETSRVQCFLLEPSPNPADPLLAHSERRPRHSHRAHHRVQQRQSRSQHWCVFLERRAERVARTPLRPRLAGSGADAQGTQRSLSLPRPSTSSPSGITLARYVFGEFGRSDGVRFWRSWVLELGGRGRIERGEGSGGT